MTGRLHQIVSVRLEEIATKKTKPLPPVVGAFFSAA
jgi:hypothetical protein